MEYLKKTVKEITRRSSQSINEIDDLAVSKLIDTILDSYAVFIVGAGRLDLIAKSFAMNLMHMGFEVHVIGETTTPPIRRGDCLIAISSSGKSKTTLSAVEDAKEINASVIGISKNHRSKLSKLANFSINFNIGIPNKPENEKKYDSLFFIEYPNLILDDSLFANTVQLFFEGLISELMARLGKREIDLKKRHAVIE